MFLRQIVCLRIQAIAIAYLKAREATCVYRKLNKQGELLNQ